MELILETQGRWIWSWRLAQTYSCLQKGWVQYYPSSLPHQQKDKKKWYTISCGPFAPVPQACCAQVSRGANGPSSRRWGDSHQPLTPVLGWPWAVQTEELRPLLPARAEEDRHCIFQQLKRVIPPLWIYFDPKFCHIKCTSKHLALLPPWLHIALFSLPKYFPGWEPFTRSLSFSRLCAWFVLLFYSFLLRKHLLLSRNICITNISQVFLLQPISSASHPFPYHFHFHYLFMYLYNIGLGDPYQKHALIVPGLQGETAHHLRTLQLKWPKQMETWGAEGLTTMSAPLVWTMSVLLAPDCGFPSLSHCSWVSVTWTISFAAQASTKKLEESSPFPEPPCSTVLLAWSCAGPSPGKLHPSMSMVHFIQLSKMICRAQFLLFDPWVAAFLHCAYLLFFWQENGIFSSLKG